jgi:hypothetical protein
MWLEPKQVAAQVFPTYAATCLPKNRLKFSRPSNFKYFRTQFFLNAILGLPRLELQFVAVISIYLFFVDENIESMKCSCSSTTPGTETGSGQGLANDIGDYLGFNTTPENTKSIFSLLGWSEASSATSRVPHQLLYFMSCLLLFVYPGHAVR